MYLSADRVIEYATLCHDANVVGLYRVLSPVHMTVLTAKPEDYATPSQPRGGRVSAKFRVGVCRPQFQNGTVG